jgi:hypothetical protein
MTSADLLTWVRPAPFQPFRIRLNSGREYEIRHPEMLRVGNREHERLRVQERWAAARPLRTHGNGVTAAGGAHRTNRGVDVGHGRRALTAPEPTQRTIPRVQ